MFTFPFNRSTFSYSIFALALVEVLFWIHATGSPVGDFLRPTQYSAPGRIMNQRSILLPEAELYEDASRLALEYQSTLVEQKHLLRVLTQVAENAENPPVFLVEKDHLDGTIGAEKMLGASDGDSDPSESDSADEPSVVKIVLFASICLSGFIVSVATLVTQICFPKSRIPEARDSLIGYRFDGRDVSIAMDEDDDANDVENQLEAQSVILPTPQVPVKLTTVSPTSSPVLEPVPTLPSPPLRFGCNAPIAYFDSEESPLMLV